MTLSPGWTALPTVSPELRSVFRTVYVALAGEAWSAPECLASLHLPFSASAPSAVSTFISILIASIGYFLKAYLWEHTSLEFLWPLSMDTGQGCGLCVLGFYMLPACVSFPWSCGFAPSHAPCLSSWVFLISSSSCMKQYCPVELPMIIEMYLYLCYPSGSQEPHIALEHLRCD